MKKVLFVLMLLMTSTTVTTFQSCSAASALTSGNVGAVAKSLLGVLTTKLGLNTTQSPVVSQLLTTFLTNKSSILGLMKTDPTAYASKFAGTQGALMSGLTKVLDIKQMSSLLNLKPTTNDAKNVLSNLFF